MNIVSFLSENECIPQEGSSIRTPITNGDWTESGTFIQTTLISPCLDFVPPTPRLSSEHLSCANSAAMKLTLYKVTRFEYSFDSGSTQRLYTTQVDS